MKAGLRSLLERLRIPVTARGWHSLMAMFFALILMFLFVTGTLSVMGHEIDWLMTKAQRVTAAPEGKQSLGASYDAARGRMPGAQVVMIERPAGPRTADQVTLLLPDGSRLLALVDPYRGVVQGTSSARTAWLTLRELHRALSSPSRKVQFAVTLMVLPLAVILVSSLLLYRRFYRGFFRLPRRGARARAVLGDLHRLLGCWALIFMVPLVLTSGEFMIEFLGMGPAYYPSHMLPGGQAAPLPAGFSGADLDRAVALATRTLPGLVVSDVTLPLDARMPIALRGDLTGLLVRSVANAVYVDPVHLSLRGFHRAEDIGTHLRLYEALRLIHYGSFAGLPGKIIWAVFGLVLSVLMALGAMIYAERLVFRTERSATGPEPERSPPTPSRPVPSRPVPSRPVPSRPVPSRLGHIWAGMGLGKWLGLAVLAFAAVATLF